MCLLDGCESVVNCAHASGMPREGRDSNLNIARTLAAARNRGVIARVIHLSTVQVYGSIVDASARFEKPAPDSVYGRLKLDIEDVLRDLLPKAADLTILRLGHVYGPGMQISREVLSLGALREFRLPFGGANPSNCLNAEYLARLLEELTTGQMMPQVCNVSDFPQRSLKEIFDWHCDAVGMRRVGTMTEEETALRLGALRYAHSWGSAFGRLGRQFGRGMRDFLESGTPEVAARLVLSVLPPSIEYRVRAYRAIRNAAAEIGRLESSVDTNIPDFFFSTGMPGTSLGALCPQVPMPDLPLQARELARWHARYTGRETREIFAF